jgi:chemotaxis signal transduction protein
VSPARFFTDAAAIARAFDATFTEAPRTVAEDTEELLGAAVAGGSYFLRLRDVKGLFSRPKIVPVPSPVPEFVGVMGLRGTVVPIYGLGALLGHGGPIDDLSWVLLVGEGSTRVGLGAREFTGYLRLERQAIATAPERGGLVRETARVGPHLRGVVDVEAVVAALRERVRSSSGMGSGNKET